MCDYHTPPSAERLLQSGELESGVLVRLNALQRSQPPTEYLLPHCTDTDNVQTAAMHRYTATLYMYMYMYIIHNMYYLYCT